MNLDPKNLELVIEECAEVIQACTKIMRFGPDESYKGRNYGRLNSVHLTHEVGQLLHCINRLDLDRKELVKSAKEKREKLKTYGPEGTYLKDQVHAPETL